MLWANFRAGLPEHVRSLEKVIQRSTVALVVVREIADLDCRPNMLLRKDLSICNMLQIWKNPLNDVLSIFHIHHDGLDFLNGQNNRGRLNYWVIMPVKRLSVWPTWPFNRLWSRISI
jgi:hypothetical protein